MRRLGHLLMGLGAAVGLLAALAAAGQLVIVGVPWLVRVALVKITLVGAVALLAAGAFTVRVARQRDQERVAAGSLRDPA